MKSFIYVFLVIIFLAPSIALAGVICVPDEKPTIQEAIDAAADGDTVLVKPGTYYENIDFKGKRIVVCSLFQETGNLLYIEETIIDGHTNGSVVTFQSGETNETKLIGFTIQTGFALFGGGICIRDSSPHLSHMIIKNNTAYRNDQLDGGDGGGLFIKHSPGPLGTLLENISIFDNFACGGGGIEIVGWCTVILNNATIHGNTAYHGNGGGIDLECISNLKIENVEIKNNRAGFDGGGICCLGDSTMQLVNVTISENTAGERGGGFAYNVLYPAQPNVLPVFDQERPCSIYLNRASAGNDIASNWPLSINLDWFTVKNPTSFHVIPTKNFTMNISRGKLKQTKADLFVKPDGNNINSGLSWANALQSIQYALSIILADANNPLTIYVAPGIYKEKEQFPLTGVSYITLQGSGAEKTVLDGDRKSRLIKIDSVTDFIVRGLTIRNGETNYNAAFGDPEYGAGIYCFNSSGIKFEKLKIIYNHALTKSGTGGGIYCRASKLTVKNVLIANNEAYRTGGGIGIASSMIAGVSSVDLVNVVIAKNSSGGYGSGIYFQYDEGQYLQILNSIIWGNHSTISSDEDHSQIWGSGTTISYSVLQGGPDGIIGNANGTPGWCNWLEGSFVADPQFVDAQNMDFQLKSSSPCIDAGNPGPLYLDKHGQGIKRNDMGIFGGAGLSFYKDDLLGTWPGPGIWQRNSDTGAWSQFLDRAAIQIYVADLNGDFLDDVAGWWDDGIWMKLTNQDPWQKIMDQKNLLYLAVGDLNGDGKKDLVGSWSDRGVWLRDAHSGQWTKLLDEPANMLAAGDMDGDGLDDLIVVWESGIWVRYSSNGNWDRILDAEGVRFIAAGDFNGDGRDDLVGSWDNKGVWLRDSRSGNWTKLHDQSADKLAVGDIDGDGQDDLLGIWPGAPGVWIGYTATETWELIHNVSAAWITAGYLE